MSGGDAAGGGCITWAQALAAKKWLFPPLWAASAIILDIGRKTAFSRLPC
jgi:hypothetical protein